MAVGELLVMARVIIRITALLVLKSGLSRRMTDASVHYYPLICKYCIHCKGGCLKNVPWYAASLSCGFFEEGEPVVGVKRSKKLPDFRVEDILVDTI
jgi:hypothetical protein